MQYIKWNSNLLWQINGGTPTRFLRGISGDGWPFRENVIEQQGNLYANLYRGVRVNDKVLVAEFDIAPETPPIHKALEAEILQWENWHTSLMAAAVVEVMKDNGTILQLDAVNHTAVFRPNGPMATVVTQAWTSPAKWWRGATEQSASGNFNDANPVNISCVNAGTVPTWVRLAVTGLVDTPKFTIGSNVVEINVDMDHALDTLAINATPPATVTHTPNGGSATNYYGYSTSATTYTLFQLPASATTNLVLTATTGNAAVIAYWYNRFGAM